MKILPYELTLIPYNYELAMNFGDRQSEIDCLLRSGLDFLRSTPIQNTPKRIERFTSPAKSTVSSDKQDAQSLLT